MYKQNNVILNLNLRLHDLELSFQGFRPSNGFLGKILEEFPYFPIEFCKICHLGISLHQINEFIYSSIKI